MAPDARMVSPAASRVIPQASRRRRSWVPMTRRRTVGLAVRVGSSGAGTSPPTGSAAATVGSSALIDGWRGSTPGVPME